MKKEDTTILQVLSQLTHEDHKSDFKVWSEVRRYISENRAHKLIKCGDKRAIEPIFEIVKSQVHPERIDAARTLKRIKEESNTSQDVLKRVKRKRNSK